MFRKHCKHTYMHQKKLEIAVVFFLNNFIFMLGYFIFAKGNYKILNDKNCCFENVITWCFVDLLLKMFQMWNLKWILRWISQSVETLQGMEKSQQARRITAGMKQVIFMPHELKYILWGQWGINTQILGCSSTILPQMWSCMEHSVWQAMNYSYCTYKLACIKLVIIGAQ